MPVANTKVVQGQGGREPKQTNTHYFMADGCGVDRIYKIMVRSILRSGYPGVYFNF